MKSKAIGSVVRNGLLIVLVLGIGTAHADRQSESNLIERALFHQRTLTVPMGTSLAQRTLLAVSLASSESQVVRPPEEFHDAYRAAYALDNARLKSDTSYNWDVSAWEYDSRSRYSYNIDGMLSQTIVEDWVNHAWVNQSRTILTYDGQGRLASATSATWDGGQWVDEGRTLYEYDGSGQLTTLTIQTWDDTGSEWINQLRTVSSYSNGELQQMVTQSWDDSGDEWSDLSRTTFAYDAQNRLETQTSEAIVGGNWMNTTQITYSYDGSDNISQQLTESWVSDAWQITSRTQYSYDGSHREINSTLSNYAGGFWFPFSTDTTTYDGDRVSVALHRDLFIPNPARRTQYTYDDVNMTEEQIDQYETGALAAGAVWVNDAREFLVYEAQASAVQIASEPWSLHYELGQNYPNPFNPTTVIQYSLHRSTRVAITIHNLLGQHVATLEDAWQEPGVYETSWDGRDESGRALPSGIYFYRLTTDEQIETRKMLLLK